MARHLKLVTVGASPKMVAAGTTAGVLAILVAVLNAVQGSPLIPLLPPAWQAVLLALIPTALVILAAFQAGPGEVRTEGSTDVADAA